MVLAKAYPVVLMHVYFKDVEIAIRPYFGLSDINEHLHKTSSLPRDFPSNGIVWPARIGRIYVLSWVY